MTQTQQPEALRLAHTLSGGKLIDDSTEWADTLHAAAGELRRQHARIAELEAQLSATHPTQQGAADGFFLLLPQRPKPEAPAGTVGLDWDAYSGAQMLAFGRDSSDAAIAALRTEQPAPATQPPACNQSMQPELATYSAQARNKKGIEQ